MIELVEKVNVQLSTDGTWYGIFRFKTIKDLVEAARFISEIRDLAKQEKLEVSDKISLTYSGQDWNLLMTFTEISTLPEAQGFMDKLKKAAKAHRAKGQKELA